MKLTPMPSVRENSLDMRSLRCASGIWVYRSQAEESVIAPPKPSICWYWLFSLTSITWSPCALAAKAMSGWAASSFVWGAVVTQTLTGTGAWAVGVGAAVAEAAGVGVVVGEQPMTKPARTAAFPRLISECRCSRRYLRIIQASFDGLGRSDGIGPLTTSPACSTWSGDGQSRCPFSHSDTPTGGS